MSNSEDPETKRAALDKAQKGANMLAAGDYEGAIRACSEVIELYVYGELYPYPYSLLRTTLEEAYMRLAEARQAEVDHENVIRRPWYPDLLCRLGMHHALWKYVIGNYCFQVRECRRCKATKVRNKHEPSVWKRVNACQQTLNCIQCSAPLKHREHHAWRDGGDSDVNVCRRCGVEVEDDFPGWLPRRTCPSILVSVTGTRLLP